MNSEKCSSIQPQRTNVIESEKKRNSLERQLNQFFFLYQKKPSVVRTRECVVISEALNANNFNCSAIHFVSWNSSIFLPANAVPFILSCRKIICSQSYLSKVVRAQGTAFIAASGEYFFLTYGVSSEPTKLRVLFCHSLTNFWTSISFCCFYNKSDSPNSAFLIF